MRFDTFRSSSGPDANVQPHPRAVKDNDNRWVLELNSLEDLVKLSAELEVGILLLEDGDDLPLLEICDDEEDES